MIMKMKVKPIEKEEPKSICKICKGLGYVREEKGIAVHTCWECLREGRL